MARFGSLYEELVERSFAKFLQAQTLSNVAYCVFSMPDGFDTYLFDLVNVIPAADARMVAYTYDGGAAWTVAGYCTEWSQNYSLVGSSYQGSMTLGASWQDALYIGTTSYAGYGYNGRVMFTRGNQSQYGVRAFLWNMGAYHNNGGGFALFSGGGGQNQTHVVQAVQFKFNVANIQSGTIRCYGMRKGA